VNKHGLKARPQRLWFRSAGGLAVAGALVVAGPAAMGAPLAKKAATPPVWGGTVAAWGADGQARSRPRPVTVLTGVATVATAADHSIALKGDGTIWTWGDNSAGELGDGNRRPHLGPVQVSTGARWQGVAVAAGSDHTLALAQDGTVWAWGGNTSGQLGDGTTISRTAPVRVKGLTQVAAIAAGGGYSLALKADGTVWAWGNNTQSQLGDGTTQGRALPVAVKGLPSVVTVAAASDHTVALAADGSVWAWGDNGLGALGVGTTAATPVPVKVPGLADVTSVAAGLGYSVVTRSDGSVVAWGLNSGGQLGDGTNTSRLSPVLVPGLAHVNTVVAGTGHTLAMTDTAQVWAWGDNRSGQLGDRTTVSRTTPVRISGLAGAVALAAGNSDSLALISPDPILVPGHLTAGLARPGVAVPPPLPQAGRAIAAARAQLGKPYLWGGTGPNAFDCSGLMVWSWAMVGIRLPRVAADQQAWATPVTAAQLRPGDLVFYGNPAHHVAMYLGNGEMIEAPYTGVPVRISPVWGGDLAGFGRVRI
jgi:alpha-tubulin suppressor-like RCC1 family protein